MFGEEKRRYFRIQFSRQIQLNFSTEVYEECQVDNISLGGMFVKGTFPHEAEEKCDVSITQTSSTTNFTFKAVAEIVRRVDDGIALKFTSMSFESLMLLELILQYEPREDSLDAEIKLPTDLPFEVNEEEFSISDE